MHHSTVRAAEVIAEIKKQLAWRGSIALRRPVCLQLKHVAIALHRIIVRITRQADQSRRHSNPNVLQAVSDNVLRARAAWNIVSAHLSSSSAGRACQHNMSQLLDPAAGCTARADRPLEGRAGAADNCFQLMNDSTRSCRNSAAARSSTTLPCTLPVGPRMSLHSYPGLVDLCSKGPYLGTIDAVFACGRSFLPRPCDGDDGVRCSCSGARKQLHCCIPALLHPRMLQMD
jgi:hypothetical protein